MDRVSRESGRDESRWNFLCNALCCLTRKSSVPPTDNKKYPQESAADPPIDDKKDPQQSSADPPIADDKDPQEGSTDLNTKDCPFCSCLIEVDPKKLNTTEIQRLVFHDKCQSCSSPDGAQIPLCDFCKHLRLGHLVQCIRKTSGLSSISIDLDPIARALSRTECDLCDFLTNATGLPQTGPSEVEIIPATSATLVIDGSARTEIKGRRGSPMREFSVHLRVNHRLGTPTDFVQWDAIHGYLSECKRSHNPLCEIHSRPTFPPGFHVIDVNKRCIIERKDFCEYMALSYVWGSRSDSACYVEQATRDNIESLKVPGGLTQLPDTIEDAIVICQNLGIKYLWADRYCIVQDNAIHKHAQIGAMADIYSSSIITAIACSGTDGVESGIPGVRRKRQWKRRSINIQGVLFSSPMPHLDQIVPGSIWNTRGWTYQEAILSRRKLLMTPTEVWFQCRKDRTYREHGPDPDITRWEAQLRDAPASADQDYSGFVDYITKVIEYTRRKLGYASDIYNAFDGIAQALYARDDGFHFGLPEPHFDAALLWYCGCRWTGSHSRCLRTCAETTPSWSWGSVTCPIMYDDSFCMSLVKWVLYKGQAADMSLQSANPEAYGTRSIELKATGETVSWNRSRLRLSECPQLLVALAINEGCIKAGKEFLSEHESFSSLRKHFTRQWPTYTDVYKEVRQVETLQSSGPNGVLFTNAQSAIFNIRSGWIQNANGMVIGGMYQVELDNKIVHEQRGDIGGDSDYRECSNYEECRNDEECCVEGIALSISGECRSVGFDGLDNSTHRDMTYFDCNDKPLTPMPRVNVMFISWEDGYAKRIGLGWMALKQWSSFNWTLKDIWLK